jgi:hypothetical protein
MKDNLFSKYQLLLDLNKSYVLKNYNQYDLWRNLIGFTPDLNKRYPSLFRTDKTPQCRFTVYENLVFFVDNATFNGVLSFSIFKAAEILLPGLSEKERLVVLVKGLNSQQVVQKTITNQERFNPIIKILPKEWDSFSYFVSTLGLPIEFLKANPILPVKDYWANTKNNWEPVKNTFHNPNTIECVSYEFNNELRKLYFPTLDRKIPLKFVTNIKDNLLYKINEVPNYNTINAPVILTKAMKDSLVLDYHLGYKTLAVQNETSLLREEDIPILNSIKTLIILFDNTPEEQNVALEIKKQLSTSVYNISIPLDYGKDASELLLDGDLELINKLINEIL